MQGEDLILLLFVAGVLSQLVKLGDFLVPPEQQQRIQLVMARAHGRLAAIQPFRVIRFLSTGPGTAVLAIPLVLFLLLLVASIARNLYTEQIIAWEWSFAFVRDALLEICTGLVGLAVLGVLSYRTWRANLASMLQDEAFGRFLREFGKLTAILVVATIPFILLMARVIAIYPDEPPALLMVVTIIALMLFAFIGMPRLAPVLSGVIALIIWGLAQIALALIALVRALTYRITVYQKGAWQAILLLVTVVLGVGVAYLKFVQG